MDGAGGGGVTRSGFKAGRRAVVVGAGPIGLLTVMHLRLGGASEIIVLEPSEMRRAKAEEVAADLTINPLTDDPAAIFGSAWRTGYGGGYSAAPRLAGAATFPVSFRSYTIIRKELTVTGSSGYAEAFDIAIRLLVRKALDVRSLTSDVVGLEGALDAFERLRQGTAIKILVRPVD